MEVARYFIFFLISGLIIRGAISYIRVCYYTNWSQFVPTYRFLPNRVPAQLCTHVIFAYADVRANNVTPTEFNDAEMYGRLNRLKRDRPSLQTLLAVGGWVAGGEKFSRLVSSETSMTQFRDNLIAYLRRNNLDGANIDWQYPTSRERGSEPGDRLRFTNFLQILQRGFEQEALTTGRNRLTLSASLESDLADARTYYQIDEIGKVLDFATLMAYDMHGEWDRAAGALHHSPLEPEIRSFVQGWIQDGFPASKLVLAVPAFGRSFTLTSQPAGSGIGQGVSGGGTAGALSNESGLLDYGEICSYIARDGWARTWLPDRSVPVAYGNSSDGWQWVGYDDPQSLTAKAAFIRSQGMAGVALWSLEHDDFSNLCQNGTYPLLRTLARELPTNSSQAPGNGSRQRPTQTTTPRNSASNAPTTTDRGALQPTRSAPTTTASAKNLTDTPLVNVPSSSGNETGEDFGQQCKISENIGTALTCPTTRGKPGQRNAFYLFCFTGFFAIECRCLPGHFFSRCLQTCDINDNFKNCPVLN